MKVVKLNKTHRLFKDGYTHAIRFNCYSGKCYSYERRLREMYGDQYAATSMWAARFGSKNSTGYTTFWIATRNEQDLTMLLLQYPNY